MSARHGVRSALIFRSALISGSMLAACIPVSAQMPTTLPPEIPASDTLTDAPPDSTSITHWYQRPVRNRDDVPIGKVADVLVDRGGRIGAFVLELADSRKNVLVHFGAISAGKNANDALVINIGPAVLDRAQAFKYDAVQARWLPLQK